jgi:hypothetical protein
MESLRKNQIQFLDDLFQDKSQSVSRILRVSHYSRCWPRIGIANRLGPRDATFPKGRLTLLRSSLEMAALLRLSHCYRPKGKS